MFKRIVAISWSTLFLELIVVFIGVYLAFMLGNFSESKKLKREEEKLMTSLKYELDMIGLTFGNMGDYQADKAKEWDSLFAKQEIADFFNWRYIQPQYNYTIMEYAINTRDSRIVSFDLYEKLVILYRELKKLEYTENLMTDWGGKYQPLPQHTDTTAIAYQMQVAANRFSFYKFKAAAKDRANIMQKLPTHAREALRLVNQHFSTQRQLELEKESLKSLLQAIHYSTEEDLDILKNWVKKHLPDFPEEQWADLVKDVK